MLKTRANRARAINAALYVAALCAAILFYALVARASGAEPPVVSAVEPHLVKVEVWRGEGEPIVLHGPELTGVAYEWSNGRRVLINGPSTRPATQPQPITVAPPTVPELPTPTIAGYDPATKLLTLEYQKNGQRNTLWVNGAKSSVTDSSGDLRVLHAAEATYQLKTSRGLDVTGVLHVTANGAVIPAGAVRVGPNHELKTLADVQHAQKADTTYVFAGHFQTSSYTGLKIRQPGVTLLGSGAIFEYVGTSTRFPQLILVEADYCTIDGLEWRGPGATVGVTFASGLTGCSVIRCTAPPMGLGQGVKVTSATDFTMLECKFPELVRYGVYASKLTRAKFIRCAFGPSSGTIFRGKKINGEHNLRIEQFEDVEVIDCTFRETASEFSIHKSTLNAKRGKDLRVSGCTFDGNVGIGPLADGDGLKHLTDPSQVAREVVLRDSTFRADLGLEMGVEDLRAERCTIKRVVAVTNPKYPQYALYRQLASGDFVDCTIGGWGGNPSRLTHDGQAVNR